MANKMLIDASHPEETRVVVLRGNRVEEFDFEAASKKQLRGNIYLAKVMRVEPSLQAAFVDYGGNRHGFLAFSEIHPDYYQIPVADRQALIEDEARDQNDEDEDSPRSQRRSRRFRRGEHNGHRAEKRRGADPGLSEPYAAAPRDAELAAGPVEPEAEPGGLSEPAGEAGAAGGPAAGQPAHDDHPSTEAPHEAVLELPESPVHTDAGWQEAWGEAPQRPETSGETAFEATAGQESSGTRDETGLGPELASPETQTLADHVPADEDRLLGQTGRAAPEPAEPAESDEAGADGEDEASEIEQLGGDAMEEMPTRQYRYRKQYKIQEVIKRRQVLLVQVVKEERGNKGAALTTYLSLAGRYSVLMPNTARGGGISRKITDTTDRQRLKSIAQELDVPEGMGVIVRTAGASRTKAEVKRDFEYLLRMWETVREITLKSTAPTLVYEEGSLIKRSIRDLYNKDIDEIVVAGEDGYREAKEFMRLLMPSHAKMVQPYRDPQPMFAKSGAEAQLDAMFSNHVTLKSGGYIVINQTEALVAIDVNSGRSTREHNIEDTALRTNLEAADEIARQLRLRDLAGLIVIDFIDMEENRNNRTVERRLKDALKNDRARIQIGRMSHFGLLEMSRQRMRTGVLEGSTVACPHCAGAGMVRSTSSIALHVLRALEDALIRNSLYDIAVKTRTAVALYILNQKRAHLRELETRFGVSVTITADEALSGTNYYALERGEPAAGARQLASSQPEAPSIAAPAERFFEDAEVPGEELAGIGAEEEAQERGAPHENDAEAEGRQRRRRRRRRGRGGDREGSGIAANAPQPPDDALEAISGLGGLRPTPAFESPAFENPALENESMISFSGPEESGGFTDQDADQDKERRSRREDEPLKTHARSAAAGSAGDIQPRPEPEALDEIAAGEAGGRRVPGGRARRSRQAARGRRSVPVEALRSEASAANENVTPEVTGGEPQNWFQVPETAPQELAGASLPPASTVPAHQPLPTVSPSAPDEKGHNENEVASPISSAPPRPEALDPARPKRSGWWQRARASWRG